LTITHLKYKVARKTEEKKSRGKPRLKYEDSIKIYIQAGRVRIGFIWLKIRSII
jgi:hypothetical protein